MEKMYFVIFMITCTVFEATVNGCPSSCTCTNTDVSCGERSLTTVPLDIPTSTRTLNLRNNNITRIDANSFKELSALTKLDLKNNNITKIDANTFERLSTLTELNLRNNNITRIDANLFKELSALTKLDLENNNIIKIDANTFERLSTLTEFDLRNNSITRIDANTFKGLSALKKLDLSENEITMIDATLFEGLSALTELCYHLWLEYDENDVSGWYCTCKVGSRMVGFCAHIASAVWYLGYQKWNIEAAQSVNASGKFSRSILNAKDVPEESDMSDVESVDSYVEE